LCQCRPAMAPEATREREEERKSEAREESESPTRRERRMRRERSGRDGTAGESRERRAESEARLRERQRANELGQWSRRLRGRRCYFIPLITTIGFNGRMGATPGIQRSAAVEPCRYWAGPYSLSCPGRHCGPERRPRHGTKARSCQARARRPSGRAVPRPCLIVSCLGWPVVPGPNGQL